MSNAETPEDNAQRIDAGNRFNMWVRGWGDGAGVKGVREDHVNHPTLGDVYAAAYRAGRDARHEAHAKAGERFGHRIGIVRTAGESDAKTVDTIVLAQQRAALKRLPRLVLSDAERAEWDEAERSVARWVPHDEAMAAQQGPVTTFTGGELAAGQVDALRTLVWEWRDSVKDARVERTADGDAWADALEHAARGVLTIVGKVEPVNGVTS
jgi:hypothetical protein